MKQYEVYFALNIEGTPSITLYSDTLGSSFVGDIINAFSRVVDLQQALEKKFQNVKVIPSDMFGIISQKVTFTQTKVEVKDIGQMLLYQLGHALLKKL